MSASPGVVLTRDEVDEHEHEERDVEELEHAPGVDRELVGVGQIDAAGQIRMGHTDAPTWPRRSASRWPVTLRPCPAPGQVPGPARGLTHR